MTSQSYLWLFMHRCRRLEGCGLEDAIRAKAKKRLRGYRPPDRMASSHSPHQCPPSRILQESANALSPGLLWPKSMRTHKVKSPRASAHTLTKVHLSHVAFRRIRRYSTSLPISEDDEDVLKCLSPHGFVRFVRFVSSKPVRSTRLVQ